MGRLWVGHGSVVGRNHPLIRMRRHIKRYGTWVQYAHSDSTAICVLDGAPLARRQTQTQKRSDCKRRFRKRRFRARHPSQTQRKRKWANAKRSDWAQTQPLNSPNAMIPCETSLANATQTQAGQTLRLQKQTQTQTQGKRCEEVH